MASEELLQEFMLDYDDIDFTENLESHKIIWNKLIGNRNMWRNLELYWYNHIQLIDFLTHLDKADSERYFRFGIECMLAFLQENFTGPIPARPVCRPLLRLKIDENYFKTALSVNSEELHPMTVHPILLFLATHIFKFCNLRNPTIQWWWQLRAIMVHQNVLQQLTQSLFTEAENVLKMLIDLPISKRWRALLEIEQAQLFNHFENTALAEKHLDKARALLGIVYEIRRELDPHTTDEPCLECDSLLLVHFCDDEDIERPPVKMQLKNPQDVRPRVQDDPARQKMRTQLPDLEQKFLLAVLQKMVSIRPYKEHRLIAQPFFDAVLQYNNTWAVRTQLLCQWSTFILRYCNHFQSFAERPDMLKRVRLQSKVIFNNIQEDSPGVLNRIGGVFACNLIPCWKRKEIFADTMKMCGKQNLIQMYTEIQQWYKLIKLHFAGEIPTMVVNTLEQRIKKDKTVSLLCWLGDATRDVTHYAEAWELSKKTSSQVQRHWGYHYVAINKFEESIPHFAISLEINPLQPDIWYHYGSAYCSSKNWEATVNAYKCYTSLKPHDYRGWRELGTAYENLGDTDSALRAYEKALKYYIVDTSIWFSFIFLYIDLGKYSAALSAYEKMMGLLPDTTLNMNALKKIAQGMKGVATDDSQSAQQDLNRMVEFIHKLLLEHRDNGFLCNIDAILAPTPNIKVNRRLCAARAFVRNTSWKINLDESVEVLEVCLELAENVHNKSVAEPFVPEIKEQITTIMKHIDKKAHIDVEYLFDKLEDLLKIICAIE